MFYLKKVIVALAGGKYAEKFNNAADELKKNGIGFLLIDGKDCNIAGGCSMEEAILKREYLWITDSGQVAEFLDGHGFGVLAYLHGDNKNESFAGISYAFEEPESLTADYLERICRRYLGVPWDILETDRLLVRETTLDDVDAFYKIYSEPSITKYMEDLYPDYDEERAYIEDYIDNVYSFYDFGVWTVIEKKSSVVIGRAGLSFREGFDIPELGFVIGVMWQHRGYAYEVCRAILGYGREEFGFKEVQALVHPDNDISIGLCKRLGFNISEKIELEGKQYIRLVTQSHAGIFRYP